MKKCVERILIMIMVTLIIVTMLGGCESRPVEDYFIQYENATTLVIVAYGEKTWSGYSGALGFIEDDIYERYKKNEYLREEKIEIYHPYIENYSVVINVEDIVSITRTSYQDFYDRYPPTYYKR